jgi:hypothetical protein
MNTTPDPGSTQPKVSAKTRAPRREAKPVLALNGIDRAARQTAAAVLEVLAGLRTPPSAAEALGITPMRYYVLETRALEGLVKACQPKPKGRVRNPDSELAWARRECERLRRECLRQQSLVRMAQRAIGLTSLATSVAKPTDKKSRRRRPIVRALKAVAVLREEGGSTTPGGNDSMETRT